MTYQHQALAAGRCSHLPLVEQMANVGSEVERALNWRAKHKADYAVHAYERALELLDLTLMSVRGSARVREIARVREGMVDYFAGTNLYGSTDAAWRSYFLPFTVAARKTR